MTEHSGSHGGKLAVRLGRAAALSLIAGTIGGAAVLAGEAFVARHRPYAQPELGLALRATVGRPGAQPLRLVLLGDSSALGVGVARLGDTVGGQLAHLLAEGPTGRQVHLSCVGVSGSRSTDLSTQVARALLGPHPDVAVILIGANDATALRRPAEAGAYLGVAVRRLREAHVEVVVGTCPDLGAVRAIAPPLRHVVGWSGRRIAQAQTIAALDAGATVVDLCAETGQVFRADAGTFCHDGFHPSADGYRIWAHALIPAVAAAANVASRY